MQFKYLTNIFKKEGFNYKQQVYLNKIPSFQTTLGAWYLDQVSRPKQTIEEKTKLKFNNFDIKFMLKSY